MKSFVCAAVCRVFVGFSWLALQIAKLAGVLIFRLRGLSAKDMNDIYWGFLAGFLIHILVLILPLTADSGYFQFNAF